MSEARFPVQIAASREGVSPRTDRCPHPLTARDSAILVGLDRYRYLDSDHITDLFFTNRRRAQFALGNLLWRGLIHRWPGLTYQRSMRVPSAYVLTSSGARSVAHLHQLDPRPVTDRARRAREQVVHLRHDLEANRFFVKLAAGARHLDGQGLYHWLGENTVRAARERDGSPASDGWGRYLLPDRELTFDLEWDRGTEHARAIRQKASGYVTYFRGRRDADLHHVLFVAPTRVREGELHDLIEDVLPKHATMCRIWTTAVETTSALGLLGRVWQEIGGEPRRVAFADLTGHSRGTLAADDCIAKERWWERRPGGGEGA